MTGLQRRGNSSIFSYRAPVPDKRACGGDSAADHGSSPALAAIPSAKPTFDITNSLREWSAQQMDAASYLFLINRLNDLFATRFFV
jgi:hypothetical protein